jgi:hypothetical protein
VADAQLAADDAGADAGGRHLDDLEPDVVGQRPPVDENAAQLVDPTLACATVYRILFNERKNEVGECLCFVGLLFSGALYPDSWSPISEPLPVHNAASTTLLAFASFSLLTLSPNP